MKDTKEIHWIVTWKPKGQIRQDMVFEDVFQARRCYDLNARAGRNPKFFSRVQETSYFSMT